MCILEVGNIIIFLNWEVYFFYVLKFFLYFFVVLMVLDLRRIVGRFWISVWSCLFLICWKLGCKVFLRIFMRIRRKIYGKNILIYVLGDNIVICIWLDGKIFKVEWVNLKNYGNKLFGELILCEMRINNLMSGIKNIWVSIKLFGLRKIKVF